MAKVLRNPYLEEYTGLVRKMGTFSNYGNDEYDLVACTDQWKKDSARLEELKILIKHETDAKVNEAKKEATQSKPNVAENNTVNQLKVMNDYYKAYNLKTRELIEEYRLLVKQSKAVSETKKHMRTDFKKLNPIRLKSKKTNKTVSDDIIAKFEKATADLQPM